MYNFPVYSGKEINAKIVPTDSGIITDSLHHKGNLIIVEVLTYNLQSINIKRTIERKTWLKKK